MARACGSYPQCQRFKSVRRYHRNRMLRIHLKNLYILLRKFSIYFKTEIIRPYGQAVKTLPFHGSNPGSSPGRVTIEYLRYSFKEFYEFFNSFNCGSIAQLGEHLPYKQGVIGSSPIVPTTFNKYSGLVVQLVRMPACHAGGRGFEPHPGRQYTKIYTTIFITKNAGVAQSVEQLTCNQ